MINLEELDDLSHSIPALEWFYKDDLSFSLLPRKTYPGGNFVRESEDAEIAYRPCYYVQSVPIWDADVANQLTDEALEVFIGHRLLQGINKLRGHLKRSLFRKLNASSFPAPDAIPDDQFVNHSPVSTGNQANVKEIVSYEEIMRSESFDSIDLARTQKRPDGKFNRLAHRTDRNEPTAFTAKLWKEHQSGIKPVGAYNAPGESPAPLLTTKYALTDPKMFEAIRNYLGLRKNVASKRYDFLEWGDRELTEMGHQNFIHQSIPFIAEPAMSIPAPGCHQIYTIDFQMLTLRPHEHFDVKITSWNRMPKDVGSYCVIVWFGNLTFQSLDSHGLLLGLDPSL